MDLAFRQLQLVYHFHRLLLALCDVKSRDLYHAIAVNVELYFDLAFSSPVLAEPGKEHVSDFVAVCNRNLAFVSIFPVSLEYFDSDGRLVGSVIHELSLTVTRYLSVLLDQNA